MKHRQGLVGLISLIAIACGQGASSDGGGGSATDAGTQGQGVDGAAPGSSASCVSCASAGDCAGGTICTEATGVGFCFKPCPSGNECGGGESCQSESSVKGDPVKVCVPRVDCGMGAPASDAGVTGVPFDGGGAPAMGTIGNNGGTASRLLFATVGDTRGRLPGLGTYPTDAINKIYTSIQALSPRPLFSVSTGDYAFEFASDTSAQLDAYLAARAKYSGAFFPALGNHECTWQTTSNCGAGNKDGMTPQYSAFLGKLLSPIGKTEPYYTINVNATDASWTSKFVFVAPNAWTAGQGTWLEAELSKPTTYTFIVRHEAASANTAPGVTPSQTIIDKHPYTLLIVGHTHTYSRNGKEVLFGNGGAPISDGKPMGFGLFSQRADGAIEVNAIDYQTGNADAAFRFAVKPDGTAAP